MDELLAYDDHLSEQISLMEKIRDEGQRKIGEAQESGSDLPMRKERPRKGRQHRPGPRITGNTQVVPPRGEQTSGIAGGGGDNPERARNRRRLRLGMDRSEEARAEAGLAQPGAAGK